MLIKHIFNMPGEQSDNTRVVRQPIIEPIQVNPRVEKIQIYASQNQAQLWDADKVKRYENMQNFYNTNFFGYGMGGRQTNYDPRTSQGQEAIQANFDYSKGNFSNFAETLVTAGATEGIGQAIRWATTPTKIGSGAEAIVHSSPISTKVIKTTTIPRSEMHIRNTVPGALKSTFIDSSNGLARYIQPKVRILTQQQLNKAKGAIDKLMSKRGWQKIIHPNLEGTGYTNKKWVVSDLGQGNVRRDWLGRIRFPDFSIESVPDFKMAIQKLGGKIINNN